MKKILHVIGLCIGLSVSPLVWAANLIDVYKQALVHDAIYQQAIANALAIKQEVPISRASLLPNVSASLSPFIERVTSSGNAAIFIGSDRRRGYTFNLSVTQTIFNFAQFSNFAIARASAKQACATLNAAQQDLMLRVSHAYFQILEDEDVLQSSIATRRAFATQLNQINQEYRAGLKTVTDFYTAQASYEDSDANYIQAKTTLADDQENLRVITGILYSFIAPLSEKFPLVTPQPLDVEVWVKTAIAQNWAIKAAEFRLVAAKQNIKRQFAGHLPTLNFEGTYNIALTNDMGGSALTLDNLPGLLQVHTTTAALNLNVPIFEGGLVTAQTRQAQDEYQVAAEQLAQEARVTTNITRQSYLGVIAGISKIRAAKKAIVAAKSSVAGLLAGYRAGTETYVNVVNQQQQLYIDEREYAHDRYGYIYNLLALKQSTGALSQGDLEALNVWLNDKKDGKEVACK